jgi:hypothetical protein
MNFLSAIKRKIQGEVHKCGHAFRLRPPSFPFLSGDTFRMLADFIIDDYSDFRKFELLLDKVDAKNIKGFVLYVSVSFFESSRNLNHFKRLINIKPSCYFKTVDLVIHNGDLIPLDSFYQELSIKFHHIYSVNLLNESQNITAIPIGLENLHFMKNGLIDRYRSFVFTHKIGSCEKDNLIFGAFNIWTNPEVRQKVLSEIMSSRYKDSFKLVPQHMYRETLARSLFSISPPGNGPDCHRTWESIYVKTVPVILRGFLAKSLVIDLPLVEVDSYDEFLSKSPDELKQLYDRVMSKPSKMAYASYWINRLKM